METQEIFTIFTHGNQADLARSGHRPLIVIVMKSGANHPGISAILFLIMAILSHELILAQDQNSGNHQNKGTIHQSYHGSSVVFMDTVRPSLSFCGKRLPHIFMEHREKMYLFKYRGEENPMMKNVTFSESELSILKYNMLLIENQYQLQIKEWMRQDKLDWNLGETIKGYYMTPLLW